MLCLLHTSDINKAVWDSFRCFLTSLYWNCLETVRYYLNCPLLMYEVNDFQWRSRCCGDSFLTPMTFVSFRMWWTFGKGWKAILTSLSSRLWWSCDNVHPYCPGTKMSFIPSPTASSVAPNDMGKCCWTEERERALIAFYSGKKMKRLMRIRPQGDRTVCAW